MSSLQTVWKVTSDAYTDEYLTRDSYDAALDKMNERDRKYHMARLVPLSELDKHVKVLDGLTATTKGKWIRVETLIRRIQRARKLPDNVYQLTEFREKYPVQSAVELMRDNRKELSIRRINEERARANETTKRSYKLTPKG